MSETGDNQDKDSKTRDAVNLRTIGMDHIRMA
jgi:hypothetical protein